MDTVQWVCRIRRTLQFLMYKLWKRVLKCMYLKVREVNISFCSNSSFATGLCNQYVKTLHFTFCSSFPICKMCWETDTKSSVDVGSLLLLLFLLRLDYFSSLLCFPSIQCFSLRISNGRVCLQVKLIHNFMVLFNGYGIVCACWAPGTALPKAVTVHSYGVRCDQIIQHPCFSCSSLKHYLWEKGQSNHQFYPLGRKWRDERKVQAQMHETMRRDTDLGDVLHLGKVVGNIFPLPHRIRLLLSK